MQTVQVTSATHLRIVVAVGYCLDNVLHSHRARTFHQAGDSRSELRSQGLDQAVSIAEVRGVGTEGINGRGTCLSQCEKTLDA